MSCSPLESTAATAPDNTEAECIDSDGDGWGWDGTGSCLVVDISEDHCDYSDAHLYDGCGWDPVNSQSCAPVNCSLRNLRHLKGDTQGRRILFYKGITSAHRTMGVAANPSANPAFIAVYIDFFLFYWSPGE